MSATGQAVMQAFSVYRLGAINCIINKNDPYNAITFYRNMMAMLPQNNRPTDEQIEKECGTEPKMATDFVDDPDETVYQSEVMHYFRRYSFLIESKIGQYMANEIANRRT